MDASRQVMLVYYNHAFLENKSLLCDCNKDMLHYNIYLSLNVIPMQYTGTKVVCTILNMFVLEEYVIFS